MLRIAPGVAYLSRADIGFAPSLPRLGEEYPADVPTEAIMHHTTGLDNDSSPNVWESIAEVILNARIYQTIRPDLGLDLPYSYLGYLMKYSTGATGFALVEGRGPYRRGAHTKYHNRTGRALGLVGNFELPFDLEPWLEHISWSWGWIKEEHGLVNLGTVAPADAAVWFHRQLNRIHDLPYTACPGGEVVSQIDKITIEAWRPPEEDDMTTYKMFQTWGPPKTWVVAYMPSGFPLYRRWVTTQEGVEVAKRDTGDPETIDLGQLTKVPAL